MQKFWRGMRVKISDEMPPSMFHFPKGIEAIIDGSYTDLCSSRGDDIYSLILLRDGKGYNSSAWYPESLLTLLDSDRDMGERIIQEYHSRLYSK